MGLFDQIDDFDRILPWQITEDVHDQSNDEWLSLRIESKFSFDTLVRAINIIILRNVEIFINTHAQETIDLCNIIILKVSLSGQDAQGVQNLESQVQRHNFILVVKKAYRVHKTEVLQHHLG